MSLAKETEIEEDKVYKFPVSQENYNDIIAGGTLFVFMRMFLT